MFCSQKCLNSPIHKFECGKVESSLEKALLKRMFYQAIAICGSGKELENLIIENKVAGKTIMDFDLNNFNENENLKNKILATTSLVEHEPWSNKAYSEYKDVLNELQNQINVNGNFLQTYLLQCLKSMTVNFFHFFWESDNKRGIAICSLSAFFAHSCDPNCEKIDVENKFAFIARKPIKAGDRLTICYDRCNFLTHPYEMRQEYFERVYEFKCACSGCANNYKMIDKLPKFIKNFKREDVKVEKFSNMEEKYLKNCEFINENIESFPSYELCTIMTQNKQLLDAMGSFRLF